MIAHTPELSGCAAESRIIVKEYKIGLINAGKSGFSFECSAMQFLFSNRFRCCEMKWIYEFMTTTNSFAPKTSENFQVYAAKSCEGDF